jgi:hypothetical protein
MERIVLPPLSTIIIGPMAGGIGGVAVTIVVVVQSSPLALQTSTIGPIAGGIGGVAVAIVVVAQSSPYYLYEALGKALYYYYLT